MKERDCISLDYELQSLSFPERDFILAPITAHCALRTTKIVFFVADEWPTPRKNQLAGSRSESWAVAADWSLCGSDPLLCVEISGVDL